MIYPLTTGFHWGALDFQWYIEACKSRPGPAQTESGFHDVNRFISLGPHPGTENLSIPEYVSNISEGASIEGTSPPALSGKLHHSADIALDILDGLDPGKNEELRKTLEDIRAVAYLGKYYAHKILGATELALYRDTGNREHQQAAVQELTSALEYWKKYTATTSRLYKNPLWTNRVGYVDWGELTLEVERDIEIAQAPLMEK
jgi:hypothetical protein